MVDDDDLFSFGLAVCPYCGEPVELESAEEAGGEGGAGQRYIEDCWVCCRPIEFSVRWPEGGRRSVVLRRLDD